MKKEIITIFLFSLLLPLHSSFAVLLPSLGGNSLGGIYNPINVQVTQDPYDVKRQENITLESRLKSQYGYSIYASCKSSVCGSYDAGNPYDVNSCLLQLESWLGMGYCQAQRENARQNLQCADGYTKNKNGGCSSNDVTCQNSFGLNSNWDGTKNNQGGLICGCKTGYEWNDSRTNCVVHSNPAPIPTKTNDQICQDNYGVNSVWYGTKNENGGLICDCKNGYQWNEGQTRCVYISKIEVPVTKNNELSTSTISETMATSTEKSKPKGFWARIWNWFNFN